MSILSELSRRLHLLTTDAIPDPPRVGIKGYTHNLEPERVEEKSKSKLKLKSKQSPSEAEQVHNGVTERQKSLPDDAIPTDYPKESSTDPQPPRSEPKEHKRPGVKTKTRSKQYKYSQGTNVVNYNIVNSNGVNIGSRTSYICNINQPSTGNFASPEGTSKPRFRQMPVDAERLGASDEEITLEDIFVIKTHVGNAWKDVARRLSYSEGQIEQFIENYKHRGMDEVIYQLLIDWKQANTKDAKIGRIVTALWACQEYDCVERLVTAHSNLS